MSQRIVTQVSVVAAFAAATLVAALAQSFPTKPIRVFVGQPGGTGPDMVTRLYAEVIGQSLGQPFIIDNRVGGGGIISAVALTQAPPDGYTLMIALSGLHSTIPAMQKLPFDPIKDFEPITLLYASSGIMLVPAASPAKTMSEFIALAKTKPGGANYGSPAHGSPAHLMGVLLQDKAGAPMTHIPYRGGGGMLVDFVAGRLDFASLSYVQAKPMIDDGKVRPLAIAGPERLPGLPQVPTLAEVGLGDVAIQSWFGVVAPKGTPTSVTAKLREEFNKASGHALVRKRMAEENLHIRTGGPAADLIKLMRDELERLTPVIKAHGITGQ